MTIQRQYSLPNCRLVLEGWGEDTQGTTNFMDSRPVMTILVNAECHIVGQGKPLSGGREFLEHLVWSVNQYAQQVLSGVPHQTAQGNGRVPVVTLHTLDNSLHRLTVRLPQEEPAKVVATEKSSEQSLEDSASSGGATDSAEMKPDGMHGAERHIDLSTVQLFDLVEAIDQLVADAQTLPDIYLDLTPVPRRRAASQEPTTNRVLPAALGISGLAIAAVALFYVPTPEFKPADPDAETTEETTEGTVIDPATPGNDPNDDDAETGETESPELSVGIPGEEAANDEATGDEEAASSSAVDDETERDGRSPVTRIEDLPSQDDIEELLTSATPIADADQIDTLTQQLREQIINAWDQDPTFDEALEYRVGVAENGDIVGFKFVNDPALTYVDEVPLLDLTYIPIDPDAAVEEPIGQFKVVFRPNGVVEVSPWYGRPQRDDN